LSIILKIIPDEIRDSKEMKLLKVEPVK
jgi:hypothetical protein